MFKIRIRLLGASSLALCMTASLLWWLATTLGSSPMQPVAYAAGIQYVAPGGNCGGPSPCYAGLQDAVDAAADGDEIRVASGTYTGIQARNHISEVVYISKTVTVQGGYTTTNWTTPDAATNLTTLDAQSHGVVLVISGQISPTIAGLHITGGYADWYHGVGTQAGGGIYVLQAAATVRDNVIDGNRAANGAGVFIDSVDAILISNTIANNITDGDNTLGVGVYVYGGKPKLNNNLIAGNINYSGDGGGVFLELSQAQLSGNTIISNTAASGGGVYLLASSATLTGNTLTGNRADGYNPYASSRMGGGAVYLDHSMANLSGNTISSNSTGWTYNRGGGILSYYSPAVLTNNSIRNNGGYYGFGVYLFASDATLTGNTITGNEHNGVDIDDSGVNLTNNMIGNNLAGVSTSYSYVTLNGNVISSNRGRGADFHKGTATLSNNTIYLNRGFGVYLYALDDAVLLHNTIAYNGRGLYQYRRNARLIGNLINRNWGTSLAMFSPNTTDQTLINNVIADNGGDMSLGGSNPRLLHTTFARNSGGLSIVSGTTMLTNTILVNQPVGISVAAGSTATLDGVLWFGDGTDIAGAGTINLANPVSGDPAFAADGYHLTAASAAIDHGVDAGITTDIDGRPRPNGAAPDLGAVEFYLLDHHTYLPAVSR